MLLAIDTATQLMSLALHDAHNVLIEQTWNSGNNHGVELATAVSEMLSRANATITDLTAVAVCVGPGTYTGLRIGVSFAKAVASARELPLIGLTTMDILAAGQPQTTGGLVTVIQAGRGRIIAATYQWRKGHWVERNEFRLMDWATLIESIDGPASVTGEIDEEGHAALNEAKDKGVTLTIVPAGHRLRRAGFLAQEALAKLEAEPGKHPPAAVVPVYVKSKDLPS
jgi:tRNA threonylcarbamoyladenosine biosynthesis protein TsaB